MLCPNCGNELESNAKFCTKCGATVDEIPVVPISAPTQQYQNMGYNQNMQMMMQPMGQPIKKRKMGNVVHNVIHVIMAIIIIGLCVLINDYSNTLSDMNSAYDSLSKEYDDYQNRSATEKTADAFWSWFE